MIFGMINGRESKNMTQDHLLALIKQLESDIARLEDAMQSSQLTIKRLVANLKSAERLDAKAVQATQLVAGQLRARDGTAYEVKRGDDKTGPL
jgi:Ni,Fe-hydrogenase III large subunit